MLAAGRLPAIALLQTKAGVVEREIDLVGAENTLEDAQARLKALLNLDRLGAPTRVVIAPTDMPPVEVKDVSVEEGLKTAMEQRPELSQAKLDQANRELSVKLARNQTFPELNVVGSVGLSGLSGRQNPNPLPDMPVTFLGRTFVPTSSAYQGGPDDALESMLSGDFLSYKVGLTVQLPLGNQSARSELQRARLEAQKGRLSLETVQQRIALEVERLARGLKASLKAMEGTRAFLDLAGQRLRMVQEGLDLGASSVTDVLEAEKNLTLAQRDALRVLIEYHKLYVMWEKVTGVTLERFQITL
jgi:outer membrane protein TolC